MTKLFTDVVALESDDTTEVEQGIESLDPTQEIDDSLESVEMAQEACKTALQRVEVLTGIKSMLGSKKLSTEAYFTSLECLTLLGPKARDGASALGVPAMEDFKNSFSAKASHAIAMESVGTFIKKAWDAVREFFKAFFKKAVMFFKRMMRMELDLVTYEKSLDQLIPKLKRYNATNKDLVKVNSKLPSLLANPGMSEIDSDFILKQGTLKITRLKTTMQQVGFSESCKFLKSGLFDSFENHVKTTLDLGVSATVEQLEQSSKLLKESGFSLLSSLFTERDISIDSLPEDVYSRIADHFDRDQVRSGGLGIMAMASPKNNYDALPCGANVFLAHQAQTQFYVCGTVSKYDDTSSSLTPVGQLTNLDNLYSFYKETVKSFSSKGVDSTIDKIENRIDRLIQLITRQSVLSMESKDFVMPVVDADETPAGEASGFDESTQQDKRVILKDLFQFLMSLLSRLQSVFREILTNFYNTFESVRFELLKYIYNSAVQFKY